MKDKGHRAVSQKAKTESHYINENTLNEKNLE